MHAPKFHPIEFITCIPQSFLFVAITSESALDGVILLQSNRADLTYLKEQIEAGNIQPVIDRTYPLSEIAAAHTYSETEHAVGKIVITIG
ncbi:hypothetical protein C7B76_10780 [filamentous cyanobacterium CCP2]|nr:hypothetical protein C7B76_10780 [filamentous cyanobacterium CCP2]